MREIKFRAWDKEKQIMIPWSLDMFNETSPVTEYGGEFPQDEEHFVLMQFTGRKDQKRIKEFPEGQEIYDCDLIKVIAEKHLIDGEYEKCEQFNASVFWEYEMSAWFYEELEYGEGGHPLANCKCEIIGNIYQNPELFAEQNNPT